MNPYHIIANCAEEQASQLATLVLEHYPASQVKLLSGPRQQAVRQLQLDAEEPNKHE